MIFFLDLETLGLDPSDLIIEVGVLAVTDDLQTEVATFEALVQVPALAIERMDETARGMHTDTGLLIDLERGGKSKALVQADLYHFLTDTAEGPPPFRWGGSGVNHFDSGVLARQWPAIRELLKYRADYDVSSVRSFAQLAGIPDVDTSDLTPHRALPDAGSSWRQAKAYLELLRSVA